VFSEDGGLAMLMGDLLTTVQENLPVKVAVFNNGALGFVEIEQKVEGLLDAYTDLHNPDFGRVAEAIGMWGRRVEEAAAIDEAVREWLQAPGPALIDVVVARNELVMPPKIKPSQLLGTALYSAKAILAGRTEDVIDLAKGARVCRLKVSMRLCSSEDQVREENENGSCHCSLEIRRTAHRQVQQSGQATEVPVGARRQHPTLRQARGFRPYIMGSTSLLQPRHGPTLQLDAAHASKTTRESALEMLLRPRPLPVCGLEPLLTGGGQMQLRGATIG
jgi:Thiamine pyrophosphate enzyme, C-terminal TPP binding domain